MHFEAAGRKALRLRLLNARDFFLRVGHGTVMLLTILLHELILEGGLIADLVWVRDTRELLSVAGNSTLTGVDGPLDRGDHIQQLSVVFRIANIVKPWMLQRLLAGHALSRVHLQQATHKTERLLGQTAEVALLERLRFCYVWELETVEARILAEALLLVFSERPEHLLNEKELVHFGVAREQRLTVTQLAHDAADGPHVNLRAVL